MSNTYCFSWDEADFAWDSNPYCWNDVCIALEVEGGGAASEWPTNFDRLDEKKKDRFIELSCMIKYEDGYKKVYEEKKLKGDMTLSADEIKLTVESILLEVSTMNKT